MLFEFYFCFQKLKRNIRLFFISCWSFFKYL